MSGKGAVSDEAAVILVVLLLLLCFLAFVLVCTDAVIGLWVRFISWGQRSFSKPIIQWPVAMVLLAITVGSVGSAVIRSLCHCPVPILSLPRDMGSAEELIDACNPVDYFFQRLALAGLGPVVLIFKTIPKIVGYDIFVPFCRHAVAFGNHLLHFIRLCTNHWCDRIAALIHLAQR